MNGVDGRWGTIGEPLVVLLALHKDEFNIDEVTFHKNMPYSHNRPKLLQMIAKGANMATRKDRIEKFNLSVAEHGVPRGHHVADRLHVERRCQHHHQRGHGWNGLGNDRRPRRTHREPVWILLWKWICRERGSGDFCRRRHVPMSRSELT